MPDDFISKILTGARSSSFFLSDSSKEDLSFSIFLPSLLSCQLSNLSMMLMHTLQIKLPTLSEIVIQDQPVNKLNPIANEITKNTKVPI